MVKKYVNKKVKEWENTRNIEAMRKCKSLNHYKTSNFGKRQDYMNKENWVEISKFRTGQITLINKIKQIDKCRLCNEGQNVIEHIFINCNTVNKENKYRRITELVKQIRMRNRNITDEEITSQILMKWYFKIGPELKLIWNI